MKMSPDVFLSRNGIRYDSLPTGNPTQIVANLITLNGMRSLNESGEFTYTRYTTVGSTPAPAGPNSFDPDLVNDENLAMRVYQAAARTGNLALVHAAVDGINEIRATKGGTQFRPQPDFDIVAASNSTLGATARALISDRQRFLDGESASAPWFFTAAGYDALVAYASQE